MSLTASQGKGINPLIAFWSSEALVFWGSMSLKIDGYEFNSLSSEPARRYQIIGERCSGTNLMNVLCRRAITSIGETEKFGWKHGFMQVNTANRSDLVIGMVRHPIKWLVSMYNRPWHTTDERRSLSFREFISSPWDTQVDGLGYFNYPDYDAMGTPLIQDRHPITGDMFEDIFALRKAKAEMLLGLKNCLTHSGIVQLEALAERPRPIFESMATIFALNQPEKDYQFMVKRRLGQKIRGDHKGIQVSDLTADDLEFIKNKLDPSLEERLGYARVIETEQP